MVQLRVLPIAALAAWLAAQPEPAYVFRDLSRIRPARADLTTATCRYLPIFGAGTAETGLLQGIVRFGELSVNPGGTSAAVTHPGEEQVWVVLSGSAVLEHGVDKLVLRRHDFLYLPPGLRHRVSNPAVDPCRILIAGYRTPEKRAAPAQVPRANLDDVPKQVVGSHPSSTLYQLLMGDQDSTRDRIAAARTLTSLFVMEFAPGGTNAPHRHRSEEEIYVVLDGHGDMVAGSDAQGKEIRRPARAGEAYLFLPGCLVGFYSTTQASEGKARILALRSRVPLKHANGR